MVQSVPFKLEVSPVKRPVAVTKTDRNPYPQARDEYRGYHHMFYADADNDPCAIMEDLEGVVMCLPLAYWNYRFVGRDELEHYPQNDADSRRQEAK
jgi:hypothetical protein